MTMQAFHGDSAIRDKYRARMAAHIAADQLVAGIGYDQSEHKGCFIGCTLDSYDHSRFPKELGLPEWTAHLADAIFEGLPAKRRPVFALEIFDAIQPGVIVGDELRDELAARRLERLLPALVANKKRYARECETALRNCIALLRGSGKSESAARSAESAAESAARSAESAAWEWEADTLLALLRTTGE